MHSSARTPKGLMSCSRRWARNVNGAASKTSATNCGMASGDGWESTSLDGNVGSWMFEFMVHLPHSIGQHRGTLLSGSCAAQTDGHQRQASEIIGPPVPQTVPNEHVALAEAWFSAYALNIMTNLGMPVL